MSKLLGHPDDARRIAGPDPRGTVRIAALERTLQALVEEIGGKQAQWGVVFHNNYVAPLERRIAWLELPWYRKLWLNAVATVEYARIWVKTKLTPAEPESGTTVPLSTVADG